MKQWLLASVIFGLLMCFFPVRCSDPESTRRPHGIDYDMTMFFVKQEDFSRVSFLPNPVLIVHQNVVDKEMGEILKYYSNYSLINGGSSSSIYSRYGEIISKAYPFENYYPDEDQKILFSKIPFCVCLSSTLSEVTYPKIPSTDYRIYIVYKRILDVSKQRVKNCSKGHISCKLYSILLNFSLHELNKKPMKEVSDSLDRQMKISHYYLQQMVSWNNYKNNVPNTKYEDNFILLDSINRSEDAKRYFRSLNGPYDSYKIMPTLNDWFDRKLFLNEKYYIYQLDREEPLEIPAHLLLGFDAAGDIYLIGVVYSTLYFL